MARDRKNGSEAEEQTQPSASGDDQASSAPTPDSTGEVANGPFKLTIPAQPEGATAPAATPPVAAVPAAPVQATPAPTGNADVSNTPGLRAGGAKAARSGTSQARDAKGRPAADAGPTRTIIENGNGSTAAPSTAAAAAGPGAAAPTASVGGSCFAGCYTPTSAQVGKHEPARNIRSAPGNSGSNAAAPSSGSVPPPGSLTCVAGCGDNRSTAIARTAAGAPPADNAKGTGRITILRGVSRTKAYGVRD